MNARARRTTVIVSILAGALVLAVVAWFVVPQLYAASQPEADPEPTIGTTDDEADAGADDAADAEADLDPAGDWQVVDGSWAGYRVDEVLNGADVTVTGRTEQVTGSVTTSSDSVTDATIEVDVASIATDEPSRDEYFTSTALETDAYPTATFTLTEPVTTDDDVAAGSTTSVELVGELEMHGVTQAVTVDADVAIAADGAQVVGSIPITFSDFDVEAPSLGFVSVEDSGFVEFSLQLAR